MVVEGLGAGHGRRGMLWRLSEVMESKALVRSTRWGVTERCGHGGSGLGSLRSLYMKTCPFVSLEASPRMSPLAFAGQLESTRHPLLEHPSRIIPPTDFL